MCLEIPDQAKMKKCVNKFVNINLGVDGAIFTSRMVLTSDYFSCINYLLACTITNEYSLIDKSIQFIDCPFLGVTC